MSVKAKKRKTFALKIIIINYLSNYIFQSYLYIIRLIKNTNFIKFSKDDRIIQTGSIVFDACTFEIYGALLNGFDQLLAHELKVPVFLAESPLTCVVEGTGVLLENVNLLKLLYFLIDF